VQYVASGFRRRQGFARLAEARFAREGGQPDFAKVRLTADPTQK
jgi:hypothetical protein